MATQDEAPTMIRIDCRRKGWTTLLIGMVLVLSIGCAAADPAPVPAPKPACRGVQCQNPVDREIEREKMRWLRTGLYEVRRVVTRAVRDMTDGR